MPYWHGLALVRPVPTLVRAECPTARLTALAGASPAEVAPGHVDRFGKVAPDGAFLARPLGYLPDPLDGLGIVARERHPASDSGVYYSARL